MNAEVTPILPAKLVYPSVLTSLFGLTKDMIENNRKRGIWLEGKHYRKNPLGKYVYNWREIEKWMEEDAA